MGDDDRRPGRDITVQLDPEVDRSSHEERAVDELATVTS
jgi:hypothetical protein